MREVVERGLRQDISSSPEMLKQAMRHWGQPAGLQGVFTKLMQGELSEHLFSGSASGVSRCQQTFICIPLQLQTRLTFLCCRRGGEGCSNRRECDNRDGCPQPDGGIPIQDSTVAEKPRNR